MTKFATDREQLVAAVVEFEHQRVGLPAVDARVRPEVVDQIADALQLTLPLAFGCVVDVTLLVRGIVLAVILRATGAALGPSLSALLAVPVELVGRLELPAPRTSKRGLVWG